ncbi:hypothetical protein ISN45_At01g039260 [Arabidopsis thaliana x Arabidopsis arenosa]|nr:hypothetical protein ISN45_At01g039260 [Arabidopsis thaliana x Arabidopsis arenosa]
MRLVKEYEISLGYLYMQQNSQSISFPKKKKMVSVSELVLYVHENVYETFIGVNIANNDQVFEYAQTAFVENGDNDDDVIYDYAPAA